MPVPPQIFPPADVFPTPDLDHALAVVPAGALERILRMAARTFEAPLCMVVLTGPTRSELLGCHGWDTRPGPDRGGWEIGRAEALALDAAMGERGLCVRHDTRGPGDPVFNPGGALAAVRAYAAVALFAAGGAGRGRGSARSSCWTRRFPGRSRSGQENYKR